MTLHFFVYFVVKYFLRVNDRCVLNHCLAYVFST
jgi:hypothetical protein